MCFCVYLTHSFVLERAGNTLTSSGKEAGIQLLLSESPFGFFVEETIVKKIKQLLFCDVTIESSERGGIIEVEEEGSCLSPHDSLSV